MAKKKRLKRVSSETSCENSIKAYSSITKALSFAETDQGEKQDISNCICSKKSVPRRIFLLNCICPCRRSEPTPCPVHLDVQRKKEKKEQSENWKKEKEKKVSKKSKELENETKQKESLLQSIKSRLFKKQTPDQTKADQTPAPETSLPEGTLLTDSLRNEETVPPQVTEESVPPQVTQESVPPQVTEESVPPQVTEESKKYLKRKLKKRAVPRITLQEIQSVNSYCWSETDEPSDSIFNAASFEIPGVPRRESDRGSYEDWVKLKSILLAGLAMGDHQGVDARNRNCAYDNEELPIWQRKRTRHIPRLY